MDRMTYRDWNGDAQVRHQDKVSEAISKLAEYEDTGLQPSVIRDLKISYSFIANMHDCGDCAKNLECEYSDQLRINCFAWEAEMDRNGIDNFNEELGKALKEQDRQEELREAEKIIGQDLLELISDLKKAWENVE